jgi:hypothetical protein
MSVAARCGKRRLLFALRAFALEFAIHLTLGLAKFAGEALESFLFVEVGFGLEAGDAGGK